MAKKMGRPPKLTELTVKKLCESFAYGCTDLEACLYADISKTALYNYEKKNPHFVEQKAKLKENPVLQARKSVVDGLRLDPNLSLKFLERKKKDEFGLQPTLIESNTPKLQQNILVLIDKAYEKYGGHIKDTRDGTDGDTVRLSPEADKELPTS